MLCFRDRSWCVQSLNNLCKNKECPRFFTEEDKEHALAWWGGDGYPLAVSDFMSPGCGYREHE